VTISLALLNSLYGKVDGTGLGLGDWLNATAAASNASNTGASAAAATVLIGGGNKVGDAPWVAVGGHKVSYASSLANGRATATVVLGGAPQVGDTPTVSVNGMVIPYSLLAGDSTLPLAAAALAAAMSSTPLFSADYTAVAAGASVAITSKRPGAQWNVPLSVSVGGHLPTLTLTKSGATLAGGEIGDSHDQMAAGLAAAANADPDVSFLVQATATGPSVALVAKLRGTGGNAIALAAGVGGNSEPLVTATASSATLGGTTAGVGRNDVPLAV
jgi:phage tail sheath gpL-like